MLHSVEGLANLYSLNSFLNKDIVNASIDIKKKIDFDIANGKSGIICDGHAERIYNEILCMLKEEKSSTPEHVQRAPPITSPVIPAAMAADNISSTFKFEPKQQAEAPALTPYESDSFNKILYGGNNVYDEDMESERINMLESIDDLRNQLNGMEGINIKTIPHVDRNSNIHDIKSVYKLLLQKKNVGMYFETARDVMLIGVNKLVNFCDGRPGRPNLTGWDRTAKLKLNSLRTEMANMVGGLFKEYSIPPILQILFSLVPSAFLHASMREKQSGLKATNDDALNDLRRMM